MAEHKTVNLNIDIFTGISGFDFHIVQSTHRYGDELNMHTHNFIELGYVKCGRGINIMNGYACSIEPGDIYIIKQRTEHQIVVYKGDAEPLVIYNCMFMPDIFERYAFLKPDNLMLQKLSPLIRQGIFLCDYNISIKTADSSIVGKIEALYSEYNGKCVWREQMIALMLLEILINIDRSYVGENEGINITRRNIIYDAMTYIRENICLPISAEEVAKAVYLSRGQFSRVFKLATGIAPYKFIMREKIRIAEEMLRSGKSAAVTAASLGYKDYSTFYRAFLSETGYSPKTIQK